jgi:molybdopterin biosynthesis enzyme
MTHCTQQATFLRRRNRRQDKRERMLRKMANWRAAKARKREQRIADGWTSEPKMERFYRFEFGVRDKLTGETHFTELKSVRHAAKALGLIVKYCQ